MKLVIVASLLLMAGCALAPQPVVQHPNHDACVSLYWRMMGMEVRDNLIPEYHYDDEIVERLLNDLNKDLIERGIAQRTVFQCMQMNTQQVSCMSGVNTFEGLSDCEHRYATKEHNQ